MEYVNMNGLFSISISVLSWVSVLQNSKEEALNTALGGDQLHLQDSGLQELSQAIIAELRHMPGNEACADCGAPGRSVISEITTTETVVFFFFSIEGGVHSFALLNEMAQTEAE